MLTLRQNHFASTSVLDVSQLSSESKAQLANRLYKLSADRVACTPFAIPPDQARDQRRLSKLMFATRSFDRDDSSIWALSSEEDMRGTISNALKELELEKTPVIESSMGIPIAIVQILGHFIALGEGDLAMPLAKMMFNTDSRLLLLNKNINYFWRDLKEQDKPEFLQFVKKLSTFSGFKNFFNESPKT